VAHSEQIFPNPGTALLLQHDRTAPGGAVTASTLDLVEARALFGAPERAVSMRIVEHAGRIYLDLADEHWRAVAIGADGWRVLGCPSVRFQRSPGMLPLPSRSAADQSNS